jgi:hypothetical protein
MFNSYVKLPEGNGTWMGQSLEGLLRQPTMDTLWYFNIAAQYHHVQSVNQHSLNGPSMPAHKL